MRLIESILDAPATSLVGRVLLTFMFWGSGLSKAIGFEAGVAEMAHFNLNPPAVFNVAVLAVQLVGSALILWGPLAWLGAGMLAVFTALTIPIAHAFWSMPQPQATMEMYVAVEHVSMIGALIVVAILRRREALRR